MRIRVCDTRADAQEAIPASPLRILISSERNLRSSSVAKGSIRG